MVAALHQMYETNTPKLIGEPTELNTESTQSTLHYLI
jgi:hypothetical protein